MYDQPPASFSPLAPNQPDTVTWVHLGDLHMVRAGEQNHRDLLAIVDEINQTFAGKDVSFVYLPGDIADDGSATAYTAVRECLDKLRLPWCAVVGDHDVHEKSFNNFQHFISSSLFGTFTVGNLRFYRLNAFSEPRPDAFLVDEQQLDWFKHELQSHSTQPAVVLMHCYPSDLKQGGERLTRILQQHRVLLVDMGHTHYNEISNDGRTLYTATRSTGQIEEGPVGYTVITVHNDTVSWHFVPLGTATLVSIISPADERLLTENGAQPLPAHQPTTVHVKIWTKEPIRNAVLHFGESQISLTQQSASVWTAELPADQLTEGSHEVEVRATDSTGNTTTDSIRIAVGSTAQPHTARNPIDQENPIGPWPERHLLGTQLGPNKNGKKW